MMIFSAIVGIITQIIYVWYLATKTDYFDETVHGRYEVSDRRIISVGVLVIIAPLTGFLYALYVAATIYVEMISKRGKIK